MFAPLRPTHKLSLGLATSLSRLTPTAGEQLSNGAVSRLFAGHLIDRTTCRLPLPEPCEF
jgi:hypothetical protein